MLKKSIREYSCQKRVEIKIPANDKKRLCAKCDGNCSWYLWASYDSRTNAFMVKKYIGEHSCTKKWKIKVFTAKFLSEKYIEHFRADQGMNLRKFSRIVQKEWNMTPSRTKLQRARRLAMKKIHGDEEAQYRLLWDYGNEIRRSNLGSSFFVTLDQNSRFEKCYFALDACKRGFLEGCRPIIFLDGCHIKTRYRGQILADVGIDPNDCIFPIAIAVVEVEDTHNRSWFLETLKRDLGINNTYPWTLMSDKQKGLINAVNEQFPDAEHRFCVRHLWQNFHQTFKGDVLKNQMWKIARSTTGTKYEENMEQMKTLSPEAYVWLSKHRPNTWVRAFQSDLPKCDILLNNICEVFNKYILDARELPILSMFERIKAQVMSRHFSKKKEAAKMTGNICPKIKKRVQNNSEYASLCYVGGAGDGVFQVHDRGTDYIADTICQSCSCKRWDLSGVPCSHVLACCRDERIDVDTMVNGCYSISMFKKAYKYIIYPTRDIKEWEKMNGPPLEPPLYLKQVGRPCKSRIKAPYEVNDRNGGKKMSRHGVIMHYGYCGEPDHNISGCKYLKNGLLPPNAQAEQANYTAGGEQAEGGNGSTRVEQAEEAHGTGGEQAEEANATGGEQAEEANATGGEQAEEANRSVGGEHATVTPTNNVDRLLDRMLQQRPTTRDRTQLPIPESTFLADAQARLTQTESGSSQGNSSSIMQGELATKLRAMKM